MSEQGDLYTCARCKGEFRKTHSDEEAMVEARALWGDIPPEDRVTICDECFQEFFTWASWGGLVNQ